MNNIDKRIYSTYDGGTKKIIATGNPLRCMLFIIHSGTTNFYNCFYIGGGIFEISKSGTVGSFNLIENNKFEYIINVPYCVLCCICFSTINISIIT